MSQTGRLFVPFKRLHSEKEFKRTRMGLAIVEQAIKRHGGKIWVEGEVGKGSGLLLYIERTCPRLVRYQERCCAKLDRTIRDKEETMDSLSETGNSK